MHCSLNTSHYGPSLHWHNFFLLPMSVMGRGWNINPFNYPTICIIYELPQQSCFICLRNHFRTCIGSLLCSDCKRIKATRIYQFILVQLRIHTIFVIAGPQFHNNHTDNQGGKSLLIIVAKNYDQFCFTSFVEKGTYPQFDKLSCVKQILQLASKKNWDWSQSDLFPKNVKFEFDLWF